MEKRLYSARAGRFEYRLTAKGHDLCPILLTLMAWGDHWTTNGAPPPVKLRHLSCGHISTPTLTCSACGEPLHPQAMNRTEDQTEAGRQ